MWVEQAGKGAAVIWTRFTFGPERAPAESQLEKLECQNAEYGGGTLRVQVERRTIFRCPLPSLFDPHERP
jgi:hypothetical protein